MKPGKLPWANDLRAFATIGVIVLHVAATVSLQYPAIPKSYFFTSVFFDSAMRWCVPVFIMLSGSFALEHYDGRMGNFFRKMFLRIILPFLFWSVVYLFFFSWNDLMDPHKTVAQLFSFILKQLLSGTASHMWYVYIIVCLYLTFPFISKWTRAAVEKEYIYFLSIWVILLFLNPYLDHYDTSFDFSYFSGYLGYLILGNYLFKAPRKINGVWLIVFFAAAFLYTALRTYFISISGNENNEVFMDNLSLNVLLMAFCMYLFFKNEQYFVRPLLRKVIDLICEHSYGIYLSHLLILNIFLWCGLSFVFIHPLLSIPIITFATVGISCTLIVLMKKIPLVKSLAG
ncbi:acyltransferase family protein [Ginsengibacter hankyongi]|uniref:Acyltransferase family protein n=1 Tax=Ginsengibacter hankyongi TaxID=2607284 RepID=A0A5J5ILJ4_9BACT|nr:acyltransferase family protein [Ginsengibacter hankyongi]KAA9040947.1 acyltransferase family protein [Ginsengibacter hankyongi]